MSLAEQPIRPVVGSGEKPGIRSRVGLVLEDIRHRFGRTVAVDGVSLSVDPGDVVCLLGPSGCGKTTVLRIAAGLEFPEEGIVTIGGRQVSGGGAAVPPEQRGVGLVFQDYALFPHLDVAGNVAFGLNSMDASTREQRVGNVLSAVGMSDFSERYPHTLSGGQQQRVALARALAPRPSVVLLDEPFSGLDARLRDKVRDQMLHALKDSGAATLMVTHDAEEAMFMADCIAVMREGKVIQTGTPDDLYCRPCNGYVAELFGEVNRLTGVARNGAVDTPLGTLRAGGLTDGTAVEILIRPEALHLSQTPGTPAARVIAARVLGRSSLIHLSVQNGGEPELHLHARAPGRFLPQDGQELSVTLDSSQAFVFPAR